MHCQVSTAEQEGWQNWILPLCLGLLVLVYLLSIDDVLGGWQDDAWYVVLGKAIATGQGFRAISLPSPSAIPYYLPGFPALLAVAWTACPSFPENTACLKLVPILFSLSFSVLSYLVLMDTYGARRPFVVSIVVVSGIHPYLTSYLGSTVMSEMPYAFLSMAAVLIIQRYARCQQIASWHLPASVFLLAGLYFVRPIGVSLILVAGIYLMMMSKLRKALFIWGGIAFVVAPWVYMSVRAPMGGDLELPGTRSYVDQFLKAYDLQRMDGVWSLLLKSGENLELIFRDAIPTHILPVSAPILRQSLAWKDSTTLLTTLEIAGLVIAVVVALQYLIALKPLLSFKTGHLLELYLLCYIGVILFWPYSPTRFFLPLVPFVTFYFFTGVGRIVSFILSLREHEAPKRRALASLMTAVIVFSFALGHLFIDARHIYDVRWRRQSVFYKDWAETLEAYRWVRDHTPSKILLASTNPAQAYLYTGRLAIYTPSFEGELHARQVAYVVKTYRDGFSHFEQSGQFVQVFSSSGHKVAVFQVEGSAASN